ncbi:RidA family protein [Rhizobium leguminosarum]|uniref:RidA family protein n=1 Tax=Rhizobium leguminosarum TaxID=384 RepID=UPI00103055AA|nr:RidA family protein [Rhizobium leguminosarum]QIO76230.1 RidA family protein [Rhizobium leguminosarum bv. trifolii]QIO83248.1 RidA family protein [Rhizobium leguminosarum bv. trifolii]TAU16499.1 RidA family protein [Rhizobium leguminosarum]TAU34806.1 RidA family protein [Rhizobium leguminosarum]TAX44016.1 RidA family protein [Rhizobium leguminosarum]
MVAPAPERRIQDMALSIPPAPTPFGSYVETKEIGSLLYLSGMLPVVGHVPLYSGVVGRDLSTAEGYDAARTACLSGLAAARLHLGSLDRVRSIAKLGVYIAAAEDFRDHPKVADGASDLLSAVFGRENAPPRIVLGVLNVPLGMPIEVELVFEIEPYRN